MIVVDQGLAGVVREQLFGEFLNQRFWMKTGLQVFEPDGGAFLPIGKKGVHAFDKGHKLGMVVYGALDCLLRYGKIKVSGTVGFEEGLAELRADIPVGLQCINIGSRYSAAKVAFDILNIFRFLIVDIAREVEIEVVFLNFGNADHPGVFRDFKLPDENIDNLVKIHVAQAVFGSVFHVASAGIDHEDTFASM